ncbi:BAG family molecular chaperone regulator 4-like [Malania oleifera]|uniref:BAG family molecular chaperone regulator 4-like n=1 Tax=Malania oleifera TaxID=397392 RepID=UPI0025ADC289|nr:BAG family molecular chaperone regulator 4-like [Malania oleifera]
MRSLNPDSGNSEEIVWEVRPGGMLVQKRDDNGDNGCSCWVGGQMITINISHDSSQIEVHVPSQSTFGDLKKIIANQIGLDPKDQRLLFRGKEMEDEECLHMVGVKNMSKVLLLENPANKERKLEEMRRNHEISNACKAIADIRAEVDKLSEKVAVVESMVFGGTKVADKEFVVLTELLMMQLLKLDSIEAEGEAKVQRRSEVNRVQSFVDTVDMLKARNSNPFSNEKNVVLVKTEWETFETGAGSLVAPPPMSSSTEVTQHWELFD